MHLVDLRVPTSHRRLVLNPNLRSLAATQAKGTAASDLRHCSTGAGCQYLAYLINITSTQCRNVRVTVGMLLTWSQIRHMLPSTKVKRQNEY